MLRDSRVKYMIPVTFKWFSQKKKKKKKGWGEMWQPPPPKLVYLDESVWMLHNIILVTFLKVQTFFKMWRNKENMGWLLQICGHIFNMKRMVYVFLQLWSTFLVQPQSRQRVSLIKVEVCQENNMVGVDEICKGVNIKMDWCIGRTRKHIR